MAVVFLALNGDGLGHLVRATIVAESLMATGEHPLILSQGIFPLNDRSPIAGAQVPSLWKASPAVRRAVARELAALARVSLPSVVVEDTHPGPFQLPRDVRRILLVRPTTFAYLRTLRNDHEKACAGFLLCDHPDSPTWPYSAAETAAIAGWRGWSVVGPIYRTASQADIAEVRDRYRITDGQRVCVFSMGGGGRHLPGDTDAERFVGLATDAAERFRGRGDAVRLIFVKGPYFPADVEVGAPFEVVAREKLMPALLAAADGAFIRAGFNTPWECLSAGTPFFPFVGTTVDEPVDARVEGMRRHGLLPKSIEEFWFDADWRERFRRSSAALVERFPGTPDAAVLKQRIVGPADGEAFDQAPSSATRHGSRRAVPLAILVEGVVSDEPALRWLLSLFGARRLSASLAVTPYLADLDASLLDEFDPATALFDVVQHGHAGVPRTPFDPAHEFSMADGPAPADEQAKIAWGKQRLESRFPGRWSGGFAPPFAAMPPWLPNFWREQGGIFVIGAEGGALPAVAAGVRVGEPGADRASLARRFAGHAVRHGHVGIVVRPPLLRRKRTREQLVGLLDFLAARGTVSIAMRQLAGAAAGPRDWRRYPWALTAWASGAF
jgi:hypothetical protein